MLRYLKLFLDAVAQFAASRQELESLYRDLRLASGKAWSHQLEISEALHTLHSQEDDHLRHLGLQIYHLLFILYHYYHQLLLDFGPLGSRSHRC